MMQKVRSRACLRVALELLVDMWFQVLLIPLTGVLFTFPSRYLFTIGRQEYLALPDGPGRFRQDCSCPVLLGYPTRPRIVFSYATITLFGLSFQTVPLTIHGPTVDPQPQCHFRDTGLGLFFPVRSPLLRESLIVFFSSGY